MFFLAQSERDPIGILIWLVVFLLPLLGRLLNWLAAKLTAARAARSGERIESAESTESTGGAGDAASPFEVPARSMDEDESPDGGPDQRSASAGEEVDGLEMWRRILRGEAPLPGRGEPAEPTPAPPTPAPKRPAVSRSPGRPVGGSQSVRPRARRPLTELGTGDPLGGTSLAESTLGGASTLGGPPTTGSRSRPPGASGERQEGARLAPSFDPLATSLGSTLGDLGAERVGEGGRASARGVSATPVPVDSPDVEPLTTDELRSALAWSFVLAPPVGLDDDVWDRVPGERS